MQKFEAMSCKHGGKAMPSFKEPLDQYPDHMADPVCAACPEPNCSRGVHGSIREIWQLASRDPNAMAEPKIIRRVSASLLRFLNIITNGEVFF